nr:hypothetical protein B0A51_10347 [Rachicladosporium sp. CCFEE 5018]
MARATRSQTAKTQGGSINNSKKVKDGPAARPKKELAVKRTKKEIPKAAKEVKKPSAAAPTSNSLSIASNSVHTFEVPSAKKPVPCELHGGLADTTPALIFTHGAGGGISTPATQDFAKGFATTSPILLYQGTMNLPNRVKACQAVIDQVKWSAALGGRSMGARAACIAAAENEGTEAVVLVNYPLVGGNAGTDVRDQILLDLPERVNVLFVIGEKDGMCPLDQLEEIRGRMKAPSWLVIVEGADHGMSISPKKASEGVRNCSGAMAALWLKVRDEERRRRTISWDSEASMAQMSDWA